MKNPVPVIVALILVIVVLAVAVGYLLLTRSSASSGLQAIPLPAPFLSGQQSSPSAAELMAPTTTRLLIKGSSFNPGQASVSKDTAVVWLNGDATPHTIVSDDGVAIKSSEIKQGESFAFTFTKTGTFSYHCSIHPDMKGTIIVTE